MHLALDVASRTAVRTRLNPPKVVSVPHAPPGPPWDQRNSASPSTYASLRNVPHELGRAVHRDAPGTAPTRPPSLTTKSQHPSRPPTHRVVAWTRARPNTITVPRTLSAARSARRRRLPVEPTDRPAGRDRLHGYLNTRWRRRLRGRQFHGDTPSAPCSSGCAARFPGRCRSAPAPNGIGLRGPKALHASPTGSALYRARPGKECSTGGPAAQHLVTLRVRQQRALSPDERFLLNIRRRPARRIMSKW